MPNLTSQLLIRLIDGVSGPARAAASALRGVGNAARAIGGGGGALLAGQLQLRSAIEANRNSLNAMHGRIMEAAAAGYALRRGLQSVINPAVSFESAMADIAKVTTFDDAGIANLARQLRQIATNEIPMAVNELAALTAAAAQSGVPEADLIEFTRLAARAGVAWGMSGADAGENLAKLRTALRMTNAQTALFADTINHLSDRTASSAPDLTDYARRVAAQGEFFGFSREQSLAFGAAMIGAGAQTDVAATSFRNMGRALTHGASATRAQRSAYAALGLDADRVSRSMQRNAVGTTLTVMERIAALPRHRQASIISDLFGDETRALPPLLNQLDTVREALGLVSRQTNYAGSVQREFAARSRTTEYGMRRFRARLNDVALVIGSSLLPGLNELMDAMGPLILQASAWAEANPRLVSQIIALTAGLIALRVALAAARFAILFLGGSLLTLTGGILRFIGVALWPLTFAIRRVAAASLLLIGRFYALGVAILAGSVGVRAAAVAAFAAMGRALLVLLNPIALVRAAFVALRFAVLSTGIGALLIGLALAGNYIYQNWAGIRQMFVGIAEGIKEAFPAATPFITWLEESVASLRETFRGLTGESAMTPEQWRALGRSIGTSIGGAFTEVITKGEEMITFFTGLPARLEAALGAIGGMIRDAFRWPSAPDINAPGGRAPRGGDAPAAPATPQGGIMERFYRELGRRAAPPTPGGIAPPPSPPAPPAARGPGSPEAPAAPLGPRQIPPGQGGRLQGAVQPRLPGRPEAPAAPVAPAPPAILGGSVTERFLREMGRRSRAQEAPTEAPGAAPPVQPRIVGPGPETPPPAVIITPGRTSSSEDAGGRRQATPQAVQLTAAPVFHLHLTGVPPDERAIAERAIRMIESGLGASIRGLQSDVGLG